MDIGYFLKLMTEKGASDMFLTTGAPVNIKVEGKLYPLGNTGLPSGMVKKIAYSLMDEGQVPQFERNLELNMAIAVKDAGRFRINVFKQRGEVGMVIRAIKSEIPTHRAAAPAAAVQDRHHGAARADPAGRRDRLGQVDDAGVDDRSPQREHVGPHPHDRGSDRIPPPAQEIGRQPARSRPRHAQLSRSAEERDARSAGRDPDRRDPRRDTMEAAISFSETGHLCLATLHSNNADQTIERILNFFPESAHKNILMNLALNLNAVISQRLVMGKDGHRLPAVEVLINTPHIRDLLRRGQIHEVKEAMDRSLQEGMQLRPVAVRLYKEGKIELEEALNHADSRDGLALKIRLAEGGGDNPVHDPYEATAY